MRNGWKRTGVATLAVALYVLVAADRWSESRAQSATPPQAPAAQATGAAADPASLKAGTTGNQYTALINQYCVGCHSERGKAGGLTLAGVDLEDAHNAEIAEKVIRKLRGGLMPPAGNRRPDSQTTAAFVSALEKTIDARSTVAAAGRVPLRRLNRREYVNAVRDLVGLNIDGKAFLPDDNIKGHFDNNATALQVSPNFIDQYIFAARTIARDAVGNPKAPNLLTTYGDVEDMVISLPPSGAPGTGRQQHRLEGMPFGTRGGFVAEHNFPADGEYELTIGDMALAREVPRMEFENTVIVLLDGKEFYRTTIGGEKDHKAIDQLLDPAVAEINGRLRKIRFKATQGQHKLAVTFLHRSFAESDERTRTSALEGGQERIQAVHALQIRGPLTVTGLSQSPSRAKIFICHPDSAPASATSGRDATRQSALAGRSALQTVAAGKPAASGQSAPESRRSPASREASEGACAQKIVDNLARRAFRRPVTAADTAPLMAFYTSGAAAGGFEAGVRDVVSAVLASPHFLYRVETGAATGAARTLTDLELASRLSFFMWSSIPDDELLTLAASSRLSRPEVLAAQVTRMLADSRAKSLSDDFAYQWLNIAKIDEITPDRGQFPFASGLLDARALLKQELRLFVDSVLRSDRSVKDLLTADHTFLNERLAMIYGIESVKGPSFRRVTLEDKQRAGLLGKGAVLMVTAYPNRTSPVLRGAWILDRLLGTPPADPPLDVPSLPENGRGQPARTLRARLEQHREKATCFACHGVMDPLGLALENFNAIGQYRTHDPDTKALIDAGGQLPDGTKIAGPDSLRRAIVDRPDNQFVQALTENLMTYALGRALDYRDMPTVRRIVRQAAADGFRFKSIVLGVISSDAFRKREGDGGM